MAFLQGNGCRVDEFGMMLLQCRIFLQFVHRNAVELRRADYSDVQVGVAHLMDVLAFQTLDGFRGYGIWGRDQEAHAGHLTLDSIGRNDLPFRL